MKKAALSIGPFQNIQDFLDDTGGQITIGEIPPIRSAALASQGKTVRVALVRRHRESVSELLLRLDSALGQAIAQDTAINEVLPEIRRRRSR